MNILNKILDNIVILLFLLAAGYNLYSGRIAEAHTWMFLTVLWNQGEIKATLKEDKP